MKKKILLAVGGIASVVAVVAIAASVMVAILAAFAFIAGLGGFIHHQFKRFVAARKGGYTGSFIKFWNPASPEGISSLLGYFGAYLIFIKTEYAEMLANGSVSEIAGYSFFMWKVGFMADSHLAKKVEIK